MSELTLVLVAGELSGDTLGAGLIDALRQRYPHARLVGIGGPKMQAAGLESWFALERLSVMGLVEVLRHLPDLLQLRRELIARCLAVRPAAYIGIDAPDFNLRIEQALHQQGIATVHYVSPSVWAWRQGRVKQIAQAVDLMLTLLPFEAQFYQQHHIAVRFVGHPLADELQPQSATSAQLALGLPAGGRYFAMLPGSRRSEVERLAPLFFAAAERLVAELPDLQLLVPAASEKLYHHLLEFSQTHYPQLPLHLYRQQAHHCINASKAVLLASGTATLECMLLERPMVVVYRVANSTAWLARRLVKIPHFALPNLLAGHSLVTECIQEQATLEHIVPAVRTLLQLEPTAYQLLQAQLRTLGTNLRRNASESAAQAVHALLEQRRQHSPT